MEATLGNLELLEGKSKELMKSHYDITSILFKLYKEEFTLKRFRENVRYIKSHHKPYI